MVVVAGEIYAPGCRQLVTLNSRGQDNQKIWQAQEEITSKKSTVDFTVSRRIEASAQDMGWHVRMCFVTIGEGKEIQLPSLQSGLVYE